MALLLHHPLLPEAVAGLSGLLLAAIGTFAIVAPREFVSSWLIKGVDWQKAPRSARAATAAALSAGKAALATGVAIVVGLAGELWFSPSDDDDGSAWRLAAASAGAATYLGAGVRFAPSVAIVGMAAVLLADGSSGGQADAVHHYSLVFRSVGLATLLVAAARHFLFACRTPTRAPFLFWTTTFVVGGPAIAEASCPAAPILDRAACSFVAAHGALQWSLCAGSGFGAARSASHATAVLLAASVDFKLRCDPNWMMGWRGLPEGVEVDWGRVNGVRTWTIATAAIAWGLRARASAASEQDQD